MLSLIWSVFGSDKIIRICSLFISHCYFSGNFYKCKFGLPMGSPLSRVMTCLFLEFLETFQYIHSKDAIYFQYIDNSLLIYPHDTSLPELGSALKRLEHAIKFSYETESNNTLLFLNFMLIHSHTHMDIQLLKIHK